ncbi:MAG: hypothetical protein II058_05665 [Rhodocyclaceae bacterium]|nr:hypothetical protein [Rhodocyclaceae bacterium]
MRIQDNLPAVLRQSQASNAKSSREASAFDKILRQAAAKPAGEKRLNAAAPGQSTVCWMGGGALNCEAVATTDALRREVKPTRPARIEPDEGGNIAILRAWRKAAEAGSSLRYEEEKAERQKREAERIQEMMNRAAETESAQPAQQAPVNANAAMTDNGWTGVPEEAADETEGILPLATHWQADSVHRHNHEAVR